TRGGSGGRRSGARGGAGEGGRRGQGRQEVAARAPSGGSRESGNEVRANPSQRRVPRRATRGGPVGHGARPDPLARSAGHGTGARRAERGAGPADVHERVGRVGRPRGAVLVGGAGRTGGGGRPAGAGDGQDRGEDGVERRG